MPRPHLQRFIQGHKRLFPAAVLAASVGIWVLAVPAGASSPSASNARHQGVVVLTNSSNGTSTVVAKGDLVVVKLASDGYRWTEASVVNASPEAVLQEESGHVFHDGSSLTTFLVVGYGQAALQARGRPECTTGSKCGTVVALWQASVVSPVVDPPRPDAA